MKSMERIAEEIIEWPAGLSHADYTDELRAKITAALKARDEERGRSDEIINTAESVLKWFGRIAESIPSAEDGTPAWHIIDRVLSDIQMWKDANTGRIEHKQSEIAALPRLKEARDMDGQVLTTTKNDLAEAIEALRPFADMQWEQHYKEGEHNLPPDVKEEIERIMQWCRRAAAIVAKHTQRASAGPLDNAQGVR